MPGVAATAGVARRAGAAGIEAAVAATCVAADLVAAATWVAGLVAAVTWVAAAVVEAGTVADTVAVTVTEPMLASSSTRSS